MRVVKKARQGHRQSWDADFVNQIRELNVELESADFGELEVELTEKYGDNGSGQKAAVNIAKLDKFRCLYLAGELEEDAVDTFQRVFGLEWKTARNAVIGMMRKLKEFCPDIIE